MKQNAGASDVLSENSETSNYFLAQLNFPAKLDRILRSPDLNDIICWLPHGRSWRVMQQKRFEKEVLPVFFRHCNYSSFIRQVNGWGFRRIQSGPDFNSYYHESFLRDDSEAHKRMKRPTVQEAAERKKQAGDPPPNFYMMPPVDTKSKVESSPSPATPSSKQDLYGETIALKVSQCSKDDQRLMLQIELVRLETHRRRVLAALQAMKSNCVSAGASPVLSQTPQPKVPAHRGTLRSAVSAPPSNHNSLLAQQRAAHEMLLQLHHHNQLRMCSPYV
jgi:hypothetical protein